MHHRGARFRGQAGSAVREMAPTLLGNLGAKYCHTINLRPTLRKFAVVNLTQQIKRSQLVYFFKVLL